MLLISPFSRFSMQRNYYAGCLLKTDFRGPIALGAPYAVESTQAWYDFSGLDLTKLKAYLGSGTVVHLQGIAATMANIAAWDSIGAAAIQETTLSADPNARELYLNLIARNGPDLSPSNPQIPFLFTRQRSDWNTTNVATLDQIRSINWRFDCVLDANVNNLQANDTDYFALGEIKYGYATGSNTPNQGAFRFGQIIRKNTGGQLYIASHCDNVANAVGFAENYNPQTDFCFAPFTASTRQISAGDTVRGRTSLVTATVGFVELRTATWATSGKGALVLLNQTGIFTPGEKLQVQVAGVWTDAVTVAKFWTGYEGTDLASVEQKYRYRASAIGSVPLGTKLRFEYRIVTPSGGRKDITTGIVQSVMTNLDTGEETTLCDFRGGIMSCSLGGVVTRIFPINAYSNRNVAAYPGDPSIGLAHRISNFEMWIDAPYALVT